jgi:hypothetical protein
VPTERSRQGQSRIQPDRLRFTTSAEEERQFESPPPECQTHSLPFLLELRVITTQHNCLYLWLVLVSVPYSSHLRSKLLITVEDLYLASPDVEQGIRRLSLPQDGGSRLEGRTISARLSGNICYKKYAGEPQLPIALSPPMRLMDHCLRPGPTLQKNGA